MVCSQSLLNVLVHHFHDEYNIMNIINLEGGGGPLALGICIQWTGVLEWSTGMESLEWSEALEWACDHFGGSFRHFSTIKL